jgi:hypothetical protein
MEKNGHLGITVGVSGLGSALWMHQQFNDLPPPDDKHFWDRVDERGRLAARGLLFIGLAAAASYAVDFDQKVDSLVHRRETHSLVSMGGVFYSVRTAGSILEGHMQRLGEEFDRPELGEMAANWIHQEASFVATAISSGIGLHLLGDIPTGNIGFGKLQLFYPLTDRGFALGKLVSRDPAFGTVNRYLFYGGVGLAGAAWLTVLARIVFPDEALSNALTVGLSLVSDIVDAVTCPAKRLGRSTFRFGISRLGPSLDGASSLYRTASYTTGIFATVSGPRNHGSELLSKKAATHSTTLVRSASVSDDVPIFSEAKQTEELNSSVSADAGTESLHEEDNGTEDGQSLFDSSSNSRTDLRS